MSAAVALLVSLPHTVKQTIEYENLAHAVNAVGGTFEVLKSEVPTASNGGKQHG